CSFESNMYASFYSLCLPDALPVSPATWRRGWQRAVERAASVSSWRELPAPRHRTRRDHGFAVGLRCVQAACTHRRPTSKPCSRRSEEVTSALQSRENLVCCLLC